MNENETVKLEEMIPSLAEEAFKAARARHLAAGRNVVEAVDGKLIETRPDGSFEVVREIPPPIPCKPGQHILRRPSR